MRNTQMLDEGQARRGHFDAILAFFGTIHLIFRQNVFVTLLQKISAVRRSAKRFGRQSAV